MDPCFCPFFNAPHHHPQGGTAPPTSFAREVTNTIGLCDHGAPSDEGDRITLAAEWAMGQQIEPLHEGAPYNPDATNPKNGRITLAPAAAKRERQRDGKAGSRMPPPTSTIALPALPFLGNHHHSPTDSLPTTIHSDSPTFFGHTVGGYVSPATYGARMAMLDGTLAANAHTTDFAEQGVPSEKALGKRRQHAMETQLQFPTSQTFEGLGLTPGYIARDSHPHPAYAYASSSGNIKRGRDQDQVADDVQQWLKKAKQTNFPGPGPSIASENAWFSTVDEGTDRGRISPKPEKKPHKRTHGYCPFCGRRISRIEKLREHFGKGKTCKKLWDEGNGDIMFSKDRLTDEEIAIAQQKDRYKYDPNIQPPLIGPGEVNRLNNLKRRKERRTKDLSPSNKSAATSLSLLALRPSNDATRSAPGNLATQDMITINQAGPSNPHSLVTQPRLAINEYSAEDSQDPATQWENYTANRPFTIRSGQSSESIYQLPAAAPDTLQSQQAMFRTPYSHAQDPPLPYSAAGMPYASNQLHYDQARNPFPLQTMMSLPPPQHFGSQELDDFAFTFSSEGTGQTQGTLFGQGSMLNALGDNVDLDEETLAAFFEGVEARRRLSIEPPDNGFQDAGVTGIHARVPLTPAHDIAHAAVDPSWDLFDEALSRFNPDYSIF